MQADPNESSTYRPYSWARRTLIASIIIFGYVATISAYAFNWKGRRQSTNLIDLSLETRTANSLATIDEARRYVVATLGFAEADFASGKCPGYNTRIESMRTARASLDKSDLGAIANKYYCNPGAPRPITGKMNLCQDQVQYPEMAAEVEALLGPILPLLSELKQGLAGERAEGESYGCFDTRKRLMKKADLIAENYGAAIDSLSHLSTKSLAEQPHNEREPQSARQKKSRQSP